MSMSANNSLTEFLIVLTDWAHAHAWARANGYPYQSPDATGMSEAEVIDMKYLAKLLVDARPQFNVGFKGGVTPAFPDDEIVFKSYLMSQANEDADVHGLSVLG